MKKAMLVVIVGGLACCATALWACRGESSQAGPEDQVAKVMAEETGSKVQAAQAEERARERALEAQEHEEEALAHADHRGRGHHAEHKFTDAARWAAMFDSPDRAAWQKPDEVLAALKLQPSMRVADLGAGTGYFTVRLARALPQGQVIANDLEPDMVRWVTDRAAKEQLANVVAVAGAADDPKLPGDLDLAIMVDTYHHIAAPTQFFGKVREALKPGGAVVIVDFKKDAPEDAPGPPAAMRVDHPIIVAHLTKLGFAHERTDLELLPYQYVIFMRKPG